MMPTNHVVELLQDLRPVFRSRRKVGLVAQLLQIVLALWQGVGRIQDVLLGPSWALVHVRIAVHVAAAVRHLAVDAARGDATARKTLWISPRCDAAERKLSVVDMRSPAEVSRFGFAGIGVGISIERLWHVLQFVVSVAHVDLAASTALGVRVAVLWSLALQQQRSAVRTALVE